jgi:hypothetical protein
MRSLGSLARGYRPAARANVGGRVVACIPMITPSTDNLINELG